MSIAKVVKRKFACDLRDQCLLFFAVSGSPFPKTVIDGSSNYLKLAQEVLSELPELGHVRLDEDAAVEQPAPRV